MHTTALTPDDDGITTAQSVTKLERLNEDDETRITDPCAVREGDLLVTISGNRYRVAVVDKIGDGTPRHFTVTGDDFEGTMQVSVARFDYAERPPRLPDAPGLWLDVRGALWTVEADGRVQAIRDADGAWFPTGLDARTVGQIADRAPFAPAQAVALNEPEE